MFFFSFMGDGRFGRQTGVAFLIFEKMISIIVCIFFDYKVSL